MTHTQYHNTKILLLVIGILFLNSIHCYSQPQEWQWAKSAGSLYSDDGGGSIAMDSGGNVFLSGFFGQPSITFGFTTLFNKGGSDMFLVKYHQSGNVFWAKSFGRTGSESASGIQADANGNIFVIGSFDGSIIVFNTDTLKNHGIFSYDFFLVKFNTSGNILWAKSFGGSSEDYASDINLGNDGSIVVSGNFLSPAITFGDTTLTIADSSTSYMFDMFIVKFDADGNVLWAKSAGGNQVDHGFGNCIDMNNNIYVTGNFRSSTISFGDTTLTNNGSWDMFVVKYDANGNVLWAKSMGGTQFEAGNNIMLVENGNIIVAGTLESSSVVIGDTVLSTRGGEDILLVKYDANGNVLWARNEGGNSHEHIGDLKKTTEKYILTGDFLSPSITLGNIILTNAGSSDMFITAFDTYGNFHSALSIGGILWDDGTIGVADANGNVYISGRFQSQIIHLGNITITNVDTLSPNPHSDIFLAKHSPFTGVKEDENTPFDFSLVQNYPNPFNPQTAIDFSLLALSNVTLKVYDILGREVATLINNEKKDAGKYSVQFDATNLPSGIYIYKLTAGSFIEMKKMVLMK